MRYGRTRVSRIRKRIDNLRAAIRAEGTPAIQDAWDALEGFLPFLQSTAEIADERICSKRPQPETKGPTQEDAMK